MLLKNISKDFRAEYPYLTGSLLNGDVKKWSTYPEVSPIETFSVYDVNGKVIFVGSTQETEQFLSENKHLFGYK